MKKHGYSRKLVIVLLTSVSATATLSACSTAKSLIDGWTNDREEQVVNGGRRVPALNPQYVAAPRVAAPSNNPVVYNRKQAESTSETKQEMSKQDAPKQDPQKRPPTFEESPIDYFDNEGNPVVPKAQAETADAEQQAKSGTQTSEGNFFTRLFGRSNEESEVQKLRKVPRKPLLDNQYAPTQPLSPVTDTAPVQAQPEAIPLVEPVRPIEMKPEPAPYALNEKQLAPMPAFTPAPQLQSQPTPSTPSISEEQASMRVSPAEIHEDTATTPPVEVSESREKPNWFERTFDRIGNQFKADESSEESPKDEADAAAESKEYPALSSVPATPEQFAVVKAENEQKMENMQAEHVQAEQDKFDLYNEPSGTQATVPVALPQPQTSTPVVAEPIQLQQAGVGSPADERVELLGHASAASEIKPEEAPIKTEPEIAQAIESIKADASATQQAIVDEKPVEETKIVAEDQPQQNRWWEGWRIFSAEAKKPEAEINAAVEEVAPAAQNAPAEIAQPIAPQQLPAPIVQMPEAELVKEEIKEPAQVVQPMVTQPAPEPVKPLVKMADEPVKEAPQVAEAEEAAPQPIEEAKPAAGALPSPQILRDVKMLPPSRYSTRAQSSSTQAQ